MAELLDPFIVRPDEARMAKRRVELLKTQFQAAAQAYVEGHCTAADWQRRSEEVWLEAKAFGVLEQLSERLTEQRTIPAGTGN